MKTNKVLHLAVEASLTLLLLIFSVQPGAHAAGGVWQWLNPQPTGNPLNGVSFLNGQFITCSEGQVFTSQDGTNWITYAVQSDVALSRVAFGGGLYVAVGYKSGTGAIVTSSNLTHWTLQSSGTTNPLQTIIYGEGLFVATGDRGTILTSATGSDWESRSSGTTNSLKSIAFGNGVYVALSGEPAASAPSGDAAASVSSDGILWTRKNIGPNTLTTVNYARGLFHAGGWHRITPFGGTEGALYVSSDGTNWSEDLVATGTPVRTVFAGTNNYYVEYIINSPLGIVGLLKSADGTNFSASATTNLVAANPPNGYAYGNGLFVGAGPAINVSHDVTNWSTVSGPTDNLSDIAYGNGAYVAVGSGYALPVGSGSLGVGSIVRSSGGSRFEVQTSPVTALLNRVLFANGVFHCVGYSGTILRSTNGTQWVQRNSSTGNHLRSLCHGNGLWMAAGDGGTVVTSPNGLAWTLRFSGTGSALNGVTSAANMFVAVGAVGTIITSPDASNWSVQFADTLDTFFDITYGNGQFVAVGANGAIWISPDGVNWSAGQSGTTNRLHAVAFNNGIFIAAGSPNDIANQNVLLVSANGSTWAALDPGTSFRLYGARSINHTFVLTGVNGTILQQVSPDSIRLGGRWNTIAGLFEFTISGGLGQSFLVQSSDSASPAAWTDRAIFTNAPSPTAFSDPTSPSHPMRLYRVVSQQ